MDIEDADRSPDVIDQASNIEARMTEGLVQDAMFKARPGQVRNADGSWPQPDCEDCGDEIPAARLLACGSIRCVYCQAALEKRSAGR